MESGESVPVMMSEPNELTRELADSILRDSSESTTQLTAEQMAEPEVICCL